MVKSGVFWVLRWPGAASGRMAAAVIALVVLGALAGCGRAPVEPPGAGQPESAAAQPAEEVEQPEEEAPSGQAATEVPAAAEQPEAETDSGQAAAGEPPPGETGQKGIQAGQTATEAVPVATEPAAAELAYDAVLDPSPNLGDSDLGLIFAEMRFFGKGAGGEEGHVCDFYQDQGRVLIDQNWYMQFSNRNLISCGWVPGERVTASITYPDGKRPVYELTAGEFTEVEIDWEPELDDLAGEYSIRFSAPSGETSDRILVKPWDVPALFLKGDHFFVVNFRPFEQVDFLIYRTDWEWEASLVGWQALQVKADGTLVVALPEAMREDITVTAIGKESGAIGNSFNPTCPEILPSRLFVGADAFTVVATMPFARSEDEIGEYPVEEFPLFTHVVIEGSPLCVPADYAYWKVRLDDGASGWMAEANMARYFLLPPEQAEALMARQCSGAPPQQLQVGGQAEVCTRVDRLIVRDRPARQGQELGRMDPGTLVAVLAGPVCADDTSWWQVQAEGWPAGWVMEGGDAVDPYYVCPVD